MKPWFTISNKAADKGPVDVLLYGEIGGGWSGDGVEAKAFREEFDAIPKASPINLRIHSPGGSVFDGLAIYNTILGRSKDVTAYVDGLAASAASFIAMAASRVVMPKTSRMMIHDAQGFAIGDSEEMKQMAEILDRESDRIADIYAGKTGKTRDAMRALMKATTWMDGNEAKDLGFADEVTDKESVKNEFDLSVFRNVPATPNQPKNGPMNVARNPEPTVMQRTQIVALLLKHGVTVDDKATDEQVVALLETALGNLKADSDALGPKGATGNPGPQGPAGITGNVGGGGSIGINMADADARIAALEAKAETERKARITEKVTNLCAERRLDVKDWLELAHTNEAPTIKALTAVAIPQGSAPINTRKGGSGEPENLTGYARVVAYFQKKAEAAA